MGGTVTVPTVVKRPAPELGPGVLRYTLDRRHGTTHGDAILGGYVLSDREVLALLVEKHERAERCGCARALARLQASGASH